MSRRGERLARVALRLGLLLGGAVAVWGAHELATAGTAYAADRPPAIRATTDSFTHVRTTPDAEAASRARAGSGDGGVARTAGATATTPAGSLRVTAPTTRWPSWSTGSEPARSATVPAGTPRAPRAVHHHECRPTDGPAGPDRTPVRPAPKPGHAPKPADEPGPAPAPKPGHTPNPGHAPKPADPVPHDRPPAADPPTPPAHGVEAPSPGQPGAAGPTGLGRVLPAPHADHALGNSSTARSRSTAASWSRSLPGAPYGPRPPASDVDPTSPTPVPGTGGVGSASAGHGDSADAGNTAWAPPALAEHHCSRADGDVPPSRASRPGTRPA
ncbi:hypothetical protein Q2K19_28585 [Micromonospora soli]|uniref:hypothetical protein n=1 Tax=Micromonospora sp. NBRC 110009 TaxID=3061627 RepID=UPI00267219DE|nr:hypothetical protein [Micromonospora sp. NBRC 110009]WKT98083.1 hypothetical protein Q2K19_28585 [Micromonospora sp. NBRC 110009]